MTKGLSFETPTASACVARIPPSRTCSASANAAAMATHGRIAVCACHLNAEENNPSAKITSAKTDTVNFKTQVQPILQKNCSPCHFPGGKLYEKLPFDKGETIVSHEAGVFKRLKKEDEVRLVKRYIDENKKS